MKTETPTDEAESANDRSVQLLQTKIHEFERHFRSLDNHIRILERERQRFSALVNYTDVGFILVDPDGRCVWTNTVFRERFEEPRNGGGDLRGVPCHQLVCRKKAPCDECPAANLFQSGEVSHHELNLPIDGSFHHVYATAVPVHALDGKLEQAIVMLQDLSELEVLRSSEEAVRKTEKRYRSVFEQTGLGMVTMRADGSVLQVNPAFSMMVGHTSADLLRKNLLDLVALEDRPLLAQRIDGAGATEPVFDAEMRFLPKDRNPIWCHVTGVWQFEDNGHAAYAVFMIHDVHERKSVKRELAQSQEQYESLVHSIDGIVWEADPKVFRFSFVSKQAERILGHSEDRWLTQPRFWRNQIHPEDLEVVLAHLREVLRDHKGGEIEYRMIAKDGRHVWLRDTVNVIVENDTVVKLRGFMVDITERKSAEAALKDSEEKLRQSQKMDAIGRLAGGIAHDFNNLLTAITGYGDLLLRRLGDHNPLRREAGEICKAAHRAADLTGQLLAFSRQQVLQPKILALRDVVEDMERMLRRMIGEHIDLVTEFRVDRDKVEADPGQIHQVLLNLVVNARDAMPGGGQLQVSTDGVEIVDRESYASSSSELEPGSYVVLRVSDTGCGMDEATKERLFEPFYTTKEPGKGTGLGLSTAYGIVRQSGGHIFVESAPGIGTTFDILLPRVDSDDAISVKRGGVEELIVGSENVLLVEDDESVRKLAREILELNGYSVLEATNGLEALARLDEEQLEVDLVITDVVMPKMGGRDLARELSERDSTVPILFLSGYTDGVVPQQELLGESSLFLKKPFTPAVFAAKVREALDHNRADAQSAD